MTRDREVKFQTNSRESRLLQVTAGLFTITRPEPDPKSKSTIRQALLIIGSIFKHFFNHMVDTKKGFSPLHDSQNPIFHSSLVALILLGFPELPNPQYSSLLKLQQELFL